MNSVFLAVSPIFVLIMMGWLFQRLAFPGENFWPMAERITYYIFFPALLFFSLYSADLGQARFWSMAAVAAGTISFVSLVMVLLRPLLKVSDPEYSSVFQGGLRFNTYVGISAAYVFFGEQGLTLAAMVIAVIIPLVNVISVAVVTRFGDNQCKGWDHALLSLVKNPLILACLFGILANLSGLRLVLGSDEVVRILSQASLSLGLLAVGAGLKFSRIASKTIPIAWSGMFKMIIQPLMMGFLGVLIGLDQPEMLVLVIFASLPCGPAAYVMARQLKGDMDMMAGIITVQTVIAALSMPLVIRVFMV